ASRARATHEVLAFSAELQQALRSDDRVSRFSGVLALVPDDPDTERLLRDSVGGYLNVALKVMLGRGDIGGAIAYNGERPIENRLQLTCRYRDREVLLLSDARIFSP